MVGTLDFGGSRYPFGFVLATHDVMNDLERRALVRLGAGRDKHTHFISASGFGWEIRRVAFIF
jgi:hypothetical protein